MPEVNDLDPLARALVCLDEPVAAALGQLPLPIWITDRVGRVRWMNVAARALFSVRLGAHFSRFVASESVADARELFARKIEGRLDSAVHRATLSTLSGRVEGELTSVPIRSDGSVIGVVSMIRPDVRQQQSQSARRLPKPRLTPRQQQVLELLAHGSSTAEIAATLQVAEDTARNHIRMLLNELRVRSRLEAVVIAFRNDWL